MAGHESAGEVRPGLHGRRALKVQAAKQGQAPLLQQRGRRRHRGPDGGQGAARTTAAAVALVP